MSSLKKHYIFFICFTLILIFIFLFSLSQISFAAYPKLVSRLINGFDTIKEWIIKIATPAAAVAVGTGVFMKKFSFGDEERIRIGKKVIRSSLFSYAFILTIDLILSAIQTLVA